MIPDKPIFEDEDWRIGEEYNPAYNRDTLMLLHECDKMRLTTDFVVKNYSDNFLGSMCYYCGSRPSEGIQAMLLFLKWDWI